MLGEGTSGSRGLVDERRSARTAVVYAIALAVSLATALVIAWLETEHQILVYGFFVFFLIPAGAAACGMVAGLGYGAALRLLHLKPSLGQQVATLGALALITFAAVQVFSYFIFLNGDLDTFGTYLQLQTTESTFGIGSSGGGARVGNWGYGLALLEIVGFAFGGAVLAHLLSDLPWCGNCHRYLRRTDKAKHASRQEEFMVIAGKVEATLAGGQPNQVIDYLKSLEGMKRPSHLIEAKAYACENCQAPYATAKGTAGRNELFKMASPMPGQAHDPIARS